MVAVELTPEVIDAGKRASDAINLHLLFGNRSDLMTKWMAITLADGSCDNELYDSYQDAVKHQVHETKCWYVCFRGLSPGGFSPKDCAIMIMFYRKAYDKGLRFIDPDSRHRAPMMTAGQYDYYDALIKRDSLRIMAQRFGQINNIGSMN